MPRGLYKAESKFHGTKFNRTCVTGYCWRFLLETLVPIFCTNKISYCCLPYIRAQINRQINTSRNINTKRKK